MYIQLTKNYNKIHFVHFLLWGNISLLPSDLNFVLKMASLLKQADWGNCGNVWTFSPCGPLLLCSPLPPAPVCLFWQNGLSWTPDSRSTDAPAGAGSSSACCPLPASNGRRRLHLTMERTETIHTDSSVLMLMLKSSITRSFYVNLLEAAQWCIVLLFT